MAASVTPSMPARGAAHEARSREVENASISMRHPDMDAAIARFAALGGMAKQMALALEIAHSRQAELTLAYRNVVSVAAGFRQRSDGQATLEPCVIFVVRRKWSARRRSQQALPGHLLTYADIDHVRALVAVPTDVQREPAYLQIRTQGASAVSVNSGSERGSGALTCMVECSGGDAAPHRLLMSALHVLSISVDADAAELPSGAQVCQRQGAADGACLALSCAAGGRFATGHQTGFDVQLAEPLADSVASVAQALGDLPFDGPQASVTSFEHLLQLIDQGLVLEAAVPSNRNGSAAALRSALAVRLRSLQLHSLPIHYRFKVGGQFGDWPMLHAELLEFELLGGAATQPGDSGCAVVCWLDEQRCCLVGMHIAADVEQGLSYVIPAWQLFDVRNYFGSLGTAERLRCISITEG